MSVEWINVSVRVPHDRRYVLVWGEVRFPGMSLAARCGKLTGEYLGRSRFNNRADGGQGKFDIESQ